MAKKAIKIKAKAKDGKVTLKALMNHPMETGQRKGKDGKKIPAHFISEVVVTKGDATMVTAHWGPSVSKNPYLSLAFAGEKGDKVKLSWKDNKGESDSAETEVK